MEKKKVVLAMVIGFVCFIFAATSGLAAPVEVKLGHVDPADICISKKGQREQRLRASLKAQPGAM